MPLAAGTRLGPYEILSALGSGGMGEVYRAIDRKLGREVAVKVIPDAFADDPERIARFQREAQSLAALNHPNIAAIFGFEESGQTRALVMELVEGLTLAGHIAGGPIPLAEALPIARQIAEALEAAHERGIIHRDLKPANVKVTAEGQVKVLDFGLAKAIEGEPSSSDASHSPTITFAMTRAGVILGTAGYMSPEQAKGKRADRRADIWAFGVVLFEMLAGRQVYGGETAAETLAAVMKDEPGWSTLPGDTPAAIRGLLRRCLEKDPKRRLQAIGEARITIDQVLTGGASGEASSASTSPRRALLWPVAAAAATMVALAAGAVAIIHFREAPQPERVLRYTIAPPEKGTVHTFALSPDGRYLAIAASVEGKRGLWLRPLDSLRAQALAGTEDAMYPFWSPDSRNVGFFAQGKLKKITIGASSGVGLIQTLCNAPDGRGGAWNRDGVIVFAPAPNGGLQRVAAAGGLPAPVTTKTEIAHRFPIFLPDGRHFLYLSSVDSGETEKDGIYVASLGSQETRRVLPDVSSVVYARSGGGNRDGYLLFIRENTLTAQPFDAGALAAVDEVFPVAERLSPGINLNYALVSASDNGMLVFEPGSFISTQLAWFDRSGKQLGPLAALGTGNGLAVSPDEKIVAITRSLGQRTTSDIWLHEFSRGTRLADTDTKFTFDPSRNGNPVWSPDGSRIVFNSGRGGGGLYLKDANGSRQEELLVHSLRGAVSDWSRDGLMLVYSQVDPKTKSDLWILPMVSGAGAADARKSVPFLQTEFNESQGQFSPDGHWMAYVSDESGRYEVYVRPFPSGPGKSKVSIAGGQQPRWRRDGKELFYLASDRKLMAVEVKAVAGLRPSFAPGTPEPLFEANVPPSFGFIRFDYAVAGDGKRFLIQTLVESAETPITVLQNWTAAVKR